jgi:hemerythrin-like domain-containing protein
MTSEEIKSLESIKTYYEKDHDRLDELFKDFQGHKSKDFPRAKNSFKEFMFGLQRHIVWEENIIFPIFEQKTGMIEHGPTNVMRMEHRQIKQLLDSLHEKVRKQDTASEKEEEMLLSVLTLHNLKEENILYPSIDNVLSNEERKSVFLKMKNTPEESYKKCCCDH